MARMKLQQDTPPNLVRLEGIEEALITVSRFLSSGAPTPDSWDVSVFGARFALQYFDADAINPGTLKTVIMGGRMPIRGKLLPALLKVIELNRLKFPNAAPDVYMVYLTLWPQGHWQGYGWPSGARQDMILGVIKDGRFIHRMTPPWRGEFNPEYSAIFEGGNQ